MTGFVSLSIATALAFHPYAAPNAFVRGAEEPGDKQPGWDDVEAETEPPPATVADPPPPTVDPSALPPTAAPAPELVKPEHPKGTGLIIAASVTGGVAWILGLSRMAFVKQCQDAVQDAEGNVKTGVGAGVTCFFKAGVGSVALAMVQVPANWATWGLAPAAGVVRGRYDGSEHAWARSEPRKSGAFIGAGAAVLAVGVIGRVTAAALAPAPYGKLADGDVDGFLTGLRLRLLGVQASAAMIGLGAGLLAYGISYKRTHETESIRLKQVRFAPEFHIDPSSGSQYTGFAVSGRF